MGNEAVSSETKTKKDPCTKGCCKEDEAPLPVSTVPIVTPEAKKDHCAKGCCEKTSQVADAPTPVAAKVCATGCCESQSV